MTNSQPWQWKQWLLCFNQLFTRAVIRLDVEASIQFVLSKRWITIHFGLLCKRKLHDVSAFFLSVWRIDCLSVCLSLVPETSGYFSSCNSFHNHPWWKDTWLLLFAGDSPGHMYYTDSNEWGSLLRDCVSFKVSTSSHFTGCHDCKHLHLDRYVMQYHSHDLSSIFILKQKYLIYLI